MKITHTILLLGLVVALALTGCAVQPIQADTQGVRVTQGVVRTHPSQGDVVEIENGSATLFTTAEGASISFRTDQLEDGHVYTAWWVVVNNPEACSSRPCPAADILSVPDTVEADVTYADGILMGDGARPEFSGYLAIGDMPESWFSAGLTDPRNAEIQIVINDHGPLIPELAATMLNTYRGGCTDDSLPPPFPATAKADGEPGPNTCRLIQFTVFQQNTQ